MKATILILIPLLLVAAACSPASSGMLVLKEAAAGTRVEVQRGQVFQISLEGNLTTGYNWIVTPPDPAILEVQGEPEFTSDSSLLGSPGTITLTFKALTPGEVALHLEYQRPWAETVPPEKAFDVTIVVK